MQSMRKALYAGCVIALRRQALYGGCVIVILFLASCASYDMNRVYSRYMFEGKQDWQPKTMRRPKPSF